MIKNGYILHEPAYEHDRQFPERYSPNDIESRKLATLFIELQVELGKDMDRERNLVPGIRMAMNLLIDLDNSID